MVKLYEVTFTIKGIEHKQIVNAGSEDEAYYSISGLYPTDDVKVIKVREINLEY